MGLEHSSTSTGSIATRLATVQRRSMFSCRASAVMVVMEMDVGCVQA